MKKTILLGVCALALSGNCLSKLEYKNLGGGWSAYTVQDDPFDKSMFHIVQIFKGGFVFRCGELNMKVESYGFSSFSSSGHLKYIVDNDIKGDKRGSYSSYLGGSELITDDRYYSFNLSNSDISHFKAGWNVKVAGSSSVDAWVTKELNLKGFTNAYNKMCGK